MERGPSPEYVKHPLIKENTLEVRLYQQLLAVRTLEKGNTLIVAPTGLGKTVIATLVIAERLRRYPGGRVLFLAPTKPLVMQHADTLSKFLKVEKISAVTGSHSPEKREELYKNSKIIVATPQTVENDILTGRLDLRDVVLVIFDEAHRAVGNYSYVYIAKKYMEEAEHPLILAITASPGGEPEKIREVMENLYIRNVEIKTPYDPDVRPYIHGSAIEWKEIELHPLHMEAIRYLKNAIRDRLRKLKEIGIIESSDPAKYSRKDYIELQNSIMKEELNDITREALVLSSSLVKLDHALELLEAQGTQPFLEFMERIRLRSLSPKAPRSTKEIIKDENVRNAIELAKKLKEEGYIHRKLDVLREELSRFFKQRPQSKAIVFVQYRDSVDVILEALKGLDNIKPSPFIGQASRDGRKGMSQKEQKTVIEKLRQGEINVIVATSVAEEGLDIPAVDLVILYEPVPSEIRWIQRRGRTGRFGKGRVIVLVGKGTRDEAYMWAAKVRERKMIDTLKKLRKTLNIEATQRSLLDYVTPKKQAKLSVFVDQRERSSEVFRLLMLDPEVDVVVKQLPVGDYILSDRVVIERKSYKDLVDSIIDGRLFSQAKELSETFSRPIIVVEGRNGGRSIHPNAIRGAIASLSVDYGIPVVFTEGAEDTYNFIKIVAKREQIERNRLPRIRGEKKILTKPEMQLFIVESLPGVGPKLARELLRHFKTVERVFTASERELATVEGVGEKRAKEIREVITSPFEEGKVYKDEEQ